jgi:co-chaperonin GroES (HSP10)
MSVVTHPNCKMLTNVGRTNVAYISDVVIGENGYYFGVKAHHHFDSTERRHILIPQTGNKMSKILIGSNPKNPQVVGSYETEATNEEKATQLPIPSGYRILCAIPEADKEYEGGIAKADITMRNEEVLTTVLFVVSLGPEAYKDTNKFPSGAWCKEGDFILVRPNSGSRLLIHGREFRLLNDDSVEAVVLDPRGISRK